MTCHTKFFQKTVTKFGGCYLQIAKLINVQSQRGQFLLPPPSSPTPGLSEANTSLTRVDVWGMLLNRMYSEISNHVGIVDLSELVEITLHK